ncbi:MAG: RNA polymerase sigma factor [Chthoniobacteraceae bacterium]|nr:RNA polymerase sigma factor [Chthoniobacteraceae bacterium]
MTTPSTLSWIEPILERFERPLIQYATSIAGTEDRARDIVQDTFLRLAQQGPLEPERLAPWLYTVCRNRAIDLKRKENRIVAMNEDSHPEPASSEPSPAARLEAKEQADCLGRLLLRLPENQREVLRLRFQCDLSYREISEITQLGEGNVGFLLHTGIKTLRQLWPHPLEVRP